MSGYAFSVFETTTTRFFQLRALLVANRLLMKIVTTFWNGWKIPDMRGLRYRRIEFILRGKHAVLYVDNVITC